MDGEQRRSQLITLLQRSKNKPISGNYLSQHLGVSRQAIVQDIALLRAVGHDIVATARGYLLNEDDTKMVSRVILVSHTQQETEDELNCIVDNGGRIRNVIIMHPVYGELVADLMLRTRREIKQFVERLEETKATTLLTLTGGTHMHTIEATTLEELDIIESEQIGRAHV